jgi:dTDP-4-amino-4,6-dideoxygalactose transaminase
MADETHIVPFNRPVYSARGLNYVSDAVVNKGGISGNGYYSRQCEAWFRRQLGCEHVLATGSCTHALEIAAILLELRRGDEIIMPSFSFVSTANAFVLRGATPVFVDIRPGTMNIDESLIEAAITPRTRAIVVMHYGGVACRMEAILAIARRHRLVVIEDAAQGVLSYYKDRPLGTLGDLATFSFHETKNYTSGEGGLLVINDPAYVRRAAVIHQKGTNRNQMLRGEVDKYSWMDIGSSFVMSELSAAYLYGQLEESEIIARKRYAIWQTYRNGLRSLEARGLIEWPEIPEDCRHNAHLFFVKVRDLGMRTALLSHLKETANVHAVFHYVPLHSSPAGMKFARFHGEDRFTTRESERLIRLPLFYDITNSEAQRVIDGVRHFFSKFFNDNDSSSLSTTAREVSACSLPL